MSGPLPSQEKAFALRSVGEGEEEGKGKEREGKEEVKMGDVDVRPSGEKGEEEEKEEEDALVEMVALLGLKDSELEYRGPCRRCGAVRNESGAFPVLGLVPHPEEEEKCVPGFWGREVEGPLFGTAAYFALEHISARSKDMKELDKAILSMISEEEGRVVRCRRLQATLDLQKQALEKGGEEKDRDAMIEGAAGTKVVVPKDQLTSRYSKYAGMSGAELLAAYVADIEKERAEAAKRLEDEEKAAGEEKEERKRRRMVPSNAPTGPRRGGMVAPSGPRGSVSGAFGRGRGGAFGQRGGRGGGFGPQDVRMESGYQPVDLEKVKKEVEAARAAVEQEARETEARDLARYAARRPKHVSESDWLSNKGEWEANEGLKRKIRAVGEKELKLQMSEHEMALRKVAEEKARGEKARREAALKVRTEEVLYFVKVREWKAADWSVSEVAERKAKEEANAAHKEKVKGVSFHLFRTGAQMAFDKVQMEEGGRMGAEEEKKWMGEAFRSVAAEALPAILYSEEELLPARPVMPEAVRAARVSRGVEGEEEDAAIMGSYDSMLEPARKNWHVQLGHLADVMEE